MHTVIKLYVTVSDKVDFSTLYIHIYVYICARATAEVVFFLYSLFGDT